MADLIVQEADLNAKVVRSGRVRLDVITAPEHHIKDIVGNTLAWNSEELSLLPVSPHKVDQSLSC